MPHGHCYLWRPTIVWLHVVSDTLIALAYVSIPFSLLRFVRRRHDLPFSWIFLCFGLFIIACGATHVLEVVTLWTAIYRVSGLVKAITAVVSLTTAALLWRLVPHALALPSPAQLRRANEELRQSHELYRTIARNFPRGAVLMFDKDLRFLVAEGDGLAAGGLSRESMEGRTLREVLPPDDADLIEPRYRAALAGTAVNFEATLSNGRTYWFQALPISNERGRIDTAMAVYQDITERKAVEDALRKSEENLETTLNSIGDAVVATDELGRIVRMNPVAESLSGWSSQEAKGKSIDSVLVLADEKTRAPMPNPIESVLRAGKAAGLANPSVLIAKDGVERPISDSATPILDVRGIVKGGVLVLRDVSKERRAEEIARALHARLFLADRMASVATLASGVAHEVNNPLSFVISNLNLLAEDLPVLAAELPAGRTRELEDMLADARTGAERVRIIVRDLQMFSRADEHKRGPVDLHRVIDLSVTMTLNEIRHRARLVKDYGAIPLIEANESRLGQVFVNLFVNAAHAIREGAVASNEIRITTRLDPSKRVVVEVRDTGTGIPPEILKRIFDPFFTTKRVAEGTGLGLAICHGIVTELGGEIEVESMVGRGTLFRVLLPMATTEAVASAPAPEVPAEGRRGRVLVVDDEEAIGRAIRRLLLSEHDVTLVPTGAEALEELAKGAPYDVILCDLMMPEMTGMELHAQLARVDFPVADRMIFLTGGVFTPLAREFLDAVPNLCFKKPFDAQHLRAVLRERIR